MDAVKFIKEKDRMCHSYEDKFHFRCNECSLSSVKNGYHSSCQSFIVNHPEKAIEIIEKWSEEHPKKTRLDDFERKYPDAKYVCGIPSFCCSDLGYCDCKDTCTADCEKCWNTPLEDYE